MGFLGLRYRRPAQQPTGKVIDLDSKVTIDSDAGDMSLRSGRSGPLAGIPSALTFDNIIAGGTCPPCTTRDFMNYLIYIERSAENLQFFLWYREYVKRFNEATTSDKYLAEEWTQAQEEETFARLQKEHRDGLKKQPAAANMFKGTDFEKQAARPITDSSNPFSTPPRTPLDDQSSSQFGSTARNKMSYREQANEAFAAAGVKAPFTIQPFREEIDRVIATYVIDDAPRQLNLSSRERKQLLVALAYTTHPTALREVARSIEWSLRLQAHPNFIRWSICNGNPARGGFGIFLGWFLLISGLVGCIVLTLSRVPRGYRAIPAFALVLGISTEFAAVKGMCVVLHGMHHRHLRPWELFMEEEQLDDVSSDGKSRKSFDSFGSSNSYEDEPWVIKYEKRNLLRKILDREVWIQDPALRSIQDTIFIQSLLFSVIISGILIAIFLCVPGGNFF